MPNFSDFYWSIIDFFAKIEDKRKETIEYWKTW